VTVKRVVRLVGLLAGVVGGLEYSLFIQSQTRLTAGPAVEIPLLCMLAGGIFGFFGLEYITIKPFNWMETKLRETPIPDLAAALGCLAIGLIMAALVGYFLRDLPYGLNIIVSAALALLFGYWGITIGLSRRDELMSLLGGRALERVSPVILDTSVIIDGRVVDIARAGFLNRKLVAPHFMLAELQSVADSAEPVRRARGRRGLEIVEELKTMDNLEVDVTAHDFPDVPEVDHKLIRLAQELGGSILTTDYNLNKVAQLEGVTVLNVNDLANALKPAVVPGEEMSVTPLKDGKEHNQGVGYLADGTMVVIEGGRHHIGRPMTVTVTSVIQTAAGRMIFAAASTGATPTTSPATASGPTVATSEPATAGPATGSSAGGSVVAQEGGG
jgi:uncharacterized protein YacL